MRTLPKRQCDAGFTLVELLVVVGIIALLAAMLTPALMAALDIAREGRTQGLIHQCELAAQAFFQDHGDYPPSHWSELDTVFETDPWNLFVGDEDADETTGDYQGDGHPYWDQPPFTSNPPSAHPLYIDDGSDAFSGPTTVNEGIEVFVACVVTQRGGAYMNPPDDLLRNTDGLDGTVDGGDAQEDVDGDYDADRDNAAGGPAVDGINDVQEATNWYFNTTDLFELVDFWGNPLIYFHNRDLANHDGSHDPGTPGDPSDDYFEDPTSEADPEYVVYADAEGIPIMVYTRHSSETVTGNYPNLNSFQLYGLDRRGVENAALTHVDGGTEVDPSDDYYYMTPPFDNDEDFLTNWTE